MSGRATNGEGSVYRRSSDGLWVAALIVGYKDDGRPIRRTVSAKTKSAVVAKRRDLERDIDDGLPTPDGRVTIADIMDSWLKTAVPKRVAQPTAENYESIANNHLKPGLGRKRAKTLQVDEVQHFLDRKLECDISTATVRRIRTVLSLALDDAVRRGVLVRNVAAMTVPPRQVPKRARRSLTIEQARQFLETLHRYPDQEALYIFQLSSGTRPGEAFGLAWDKVDFEQSTASIQQALSRRRGGNAMSEGKTYRKGWRTIELPPPAIEALRQQQERQAKAREHAGRAWKETGLVFTTPIGTALDPDNQRRVFNNVIKAAGLGHWSPHELRHSAGSIMLAQGVPIEVVSKILGHSSIRVTADTYAHLLKPQQSGAAKAMGDALWGSNDVEGKSA